MKTPSLTLIAYLAAFTVKAQNIIEKHSFGLNSLNAN
jgi:hypothetical protein